MRISDWSSDVCSSDLFEVGDGDAAEDAALDGVQHLRIAEGGDVALALQPRFAGVDGERDVDRQHQLEIDGDALACAALCEEIGRASRGDRVCQYVWM